MVGVGLEAAQDEGFGLRRHGLWDLWMDLEHAHLQRKESSDFRGDTKTFSKNSSPPMLKVRDSRDNETFLGGVLT